MTNVKAAMKWAVTVLMAAALAAGGATPSSNIPIGQMPTATAVQGGAYLPIIQPRPGQTTNDNYKAQVDTLFTGRNAISVTNLYVTNLFVENLTIITNGTVTGDVWTQFPEFVAPTASSNNFHLTTNGAMLSGISVGPWWNPDTDDVLIGVHDVAQGDSDYAKVYVAAVDDAASASAYSSVRLQVSSGATASGQINLASTQGADTSRFTVNVQPDAAVANVQLYNKGVLNFAVNDASGYSGTGTNFLADDGSYKPGTGTRINPTDNFMPYRLDGATFDDSPMYRVDAQTVGVDTIDANVISATNLQSGGVVYSRADGILTNVPSGTGLLYNDGSDTNLTWIDASGIGMWTNRAGVLQPIDLTLPVGWTNQLILGPGTTNVVYRFESALRYTNGAINNVNFEVYNGDAKNTSLNVSTGSGAVQTSEPLLGFSAGSVSATLDASNLGWRPNNMAEISLGTTAANWNNLYITNQIKWGPGSSNVLYRSGTDLVYTNGVTSGVSLQVKDGGANTASFGTDSGGNALVSATSGKSVKLGPDSTAEVYFASPTGFYPNSTNLSLGIFALNNRWGDLQQAGTFYSYGHLSGTGLTNYSRLAVSHTGTSGAVVFDSQSSGTAGDARGYEWRSNGVTVASIAANSGYAGTGGRLLSDDGTYKTALSIAATPDPSIILTNILSANLASGTNDIYTIPAGKRGRPIGNFNACPSAATATLFTYMKRGGTYYALTGGTLATTNGLANSFSNGSFVFEPGDTLAISANQTMYFTIGVQLFPTNIAFRSVCNLSLSASTNLIYTCPTGKVATPINGFGGTSPSSVTLGYVNASGGNRAIQRFIVPSGGTLGDQYKISGNTAVGDNSPSSISLSMLSEGDTVYISTDSSAALQWAFLTVFEQ